MLGVGPARRPRVVGRAEGAAHGMCLAPRPDTSSVPPATVPFPSPLPTEPSCRQYASNSGVNFNAFPYANKVRGAHLAAAMLRWQAEVADRGGRLRWPHPMAAGLGTVQGRRSICCLILPPTAPSAPLPPLVLPPAPHVSAGTGVDMFLSAAPTCPTCSPLGMRPACSTRSGSPPASTG